MNDHEHDDNGPMKEPYAREHVEKTHGWSIVDSRFSTYFTVLWRHYREHQRSRFTVVKEQ